MLFVPILMPFIVLLFIMCIAMISTTKMNKRAEIGQPWQIPLVVVKKLPPFLFLVLSKF